MRELKALLLSGAALLAGPACAQTDAAADVAEVVVTGTSIKGVAAVGSKAQAVNAEEIRSTGLSNTNDILKTIPSFVNLGADEGRGGSVQGAVANITQASTVNLRGLGPESTLVMLDGRRIILGGSQGQFYDTSVIAANAISRVEVVADGASAIYGSDAVGGVVNFITPRRREGGETRFRYGDGKGFHDWRFAQDFGHTWGSGDVYLAYEHFERTGLLGNERERITQDLRPYGGPDLRTNFSSPGTIVVGTTTYAVPTGQNGRGLTAAQLRAGTANLADLNDGRSFLPDQERNSVFLSARQRIGENLTVWYGGFFSRRRYEGEGTSISAGAATATIAVPRANPFFVHPTTPTAASVNVNYSFINDFRAIATGGEQSFQNAVGLTWEAPYDWTVDFLVSDNGNRANRRIDGQVRTAALAAALADTNPATAFNAFCDGAAFTCNNPDTLRKIQGFSFIGTRLKMQDAVLKASGPLFEAWGGTARAAVGIEYTYSKGFFANGRNTNTTVDNPVIPWNPVDRRVSAAFGELLLPLIGEGNASPGFQRLDLSFAGRIEDYSDFGTTTNPKVGVRWDPIPELSLRGSWGTSFRAPTLADIEPLGTTGPSPVNVLDPTTGRNIRAINILGPKPGVQPESATTWSIGADWRPEALPGFSASVTYYDIDYKDRLGSLPTTTLLANESKFPDLVIRNPSRDLVLQLMRNPFYTAAPEPPENILIVIDGRRSNLGGLKQAGIDVSLDYTRDVLGGTFVAGLDANFITKAQQADGPGFPFIDVLDVIYNPVTPRMRGQLGWRQGPWRADLFVNHVGAYDNNLVTPKQRVDTWTTADASVSWASPAEGLWMTRGIRVTLSATNLTDSDPPVVINTLAGNQGALDNVNHSAIGRVLAIEVSKAW